MKIDVTDAIIEALETMSESDTLEFFDNVYNSSGNLSLVHSESLTTESAFDIASFKCINEQNIQDNYKEKLMKHYSEYLDRMLSMMGYNED